MSEKQIDKLYLSLNLPGAYRHIYIKTRYKEKFHFLSLIYLLMVVVEDDSIIHKRVLALLLCSSGLLPKKTFPWNFKTGAQKLTYALFAHEHFSKQKLPTEAFCEQALCKPQHLTCPVNFQVFKKVAFVCCSYWFFFSQKFANWKKSIYSKTTRSGSLTEFCLFAWSAIYADYNITPGVSIITSETNQMHLFFKVYCPSITSKKHWQETHFTVLMKEHFLLLLFPFVTSQTLGIH